MSTKQMPTLILMVLILITGISLLPSPVKGQSTEEQLSIYIWRNLSHLNPYQTSLRHEAELSSLTLEPLARYNDQGVLIPTLATDIPTIENGGLSEDRLRLTWRLRDDLLWSDGTPVTTLDLLFTYQYCSEAATGCTSFDRFESIDTVTVLDNLSIEITFKEPQSYPYLPFVGHQSPILQQAQFKDCTGLAAANCTAQNQKPIGTGPFIVTSFVANGNAELEANPYFREPGKPFFRGINVHKIQSAEDAARAVLETNEGDFAYNILAAQEILSSLEKNGHGQVEVSYENCVERLMVNFTNDDPALGDDRSLWLNGTNPHPFLSDPAVRQALSMAIDREMLTEVGYGEYGRPTCNIITAPDDYASNENNACLVQDIPQANALLDNANIIDTDGDGIREKDGIPLEILFATSTGNVRQQYQAMISQSWAEIGVATESRNIDAAVFFGGDPSSVDTYQKFYADIQMYTNCSNVWRFEQYLSNWLISEIPGPENNWGGKNTPRYANQTYEEMYAQLTSTAEIEQRQSLVKALNNHLIQEGVMIPITLRGTPHAISSDIDGAKINPWDSAFWNIADWHRLDLGGTSTVYLPLIIERIEK